MAAPPPVPLLLAAPGGPWGGPRLFPRALAALRGAPAPVHVVAVFGPRGSGKSFLLDQLAGPGGAFPSSPGLWLRCRPHPTQPGHALVLLDAGGFPVPGDEDDDVEDPWFLQLLVLQLLLASVFVYSSGAVAEPQEELERLTYVQALPCRLRLLEEEEDEEDEGALLRTVLPPFVWSLRGAAVPPEDEAVLEAEGHELRAALGTPPGLEAPVTRRVLTLFPEHKLFRLEAGSTGGLPRLCAHLLSCGPKTGLSGERVGGAYLAALAERAAEALHGAEPLRVARLCQEAEAAALQDEAEDVARLWRGEEVAQPDAADAWWSGADTKWGDNGDAVTEKELADAWNGDTVSQRDVNGWQGDTVTEEDIANAWYGDAATQRDVNAWHGDAVKEEDEVEIWCGGTATQRDVNQSNGDTATQQDINAWHGDAAPPHDAVAWLDGASPWQDNASLAAGDTPEAVPQPQGSPMGAPLCLVRNEAGGRLVLSRRALEVLRGIGQPVVVVAIAGPYRTGKSFLMNRLAQRRTGFPLGHTVQAQTKGIWMWCLPHPRRANTTLVLLDTEGLGDPNKGDSRNDAWIFTLALLLSSTLVYNSLGTIDQQALENLGVVTALTERVRVRAGDSRDAAAADFVRFFPGFVWAVRDFVLELSQDGQRITEDEYLENALRLQPGSSRVVQEQNELRRCLRDFFPERKCFVMLPPAKPQAMKQLEELDEGQLCPGFLRQADAFCRHVWDKAPVKALPGRQAVTGSMLASLAERYVAAIASSGVLCLESAVMALATAENTAAVAAAVAEYKQRMERELKLPTASQEVLGDVHRRCERRALALFMARVFADKEQRYQGQLMHELEAAKEEFCRRNEAASAERCRAVLRELWQDVEQRLDRGEYAVPGGSRRFQERLGELMEEYHRRPGKGVKAAAALEEFLREREVLARALCAADQQLSERERERVASEALAAAAASAVAEATKAFEARQEEQQRSFKEHQRQLEERLWREQWAMLEEQERIIEHKLQEQRALLQEGFKEEAEKLRKQIEKLREEKEEIKKPSWRRRALDGLGIVADIFLPGLARVAVSGALRLIRRVL
ncbi:guanylate-binding protein 1-like isoform X2 [Cygnus atratus]|uniref:guanylate-binding protein 1-like isoform X2 n=1 Tax=Cygnus atratus TaxID=8868 RepID=UPI0021B8026B|nr:guanylate-binding protein 1-like isoform X2 [Cygnus atratus]